MERSFLYLVISCNLYYIRIVSYSLAHNSSKFHKPLKKISHFFSFYSNAILRYGQTNLLKTYYIIISNPMYTQNKSNI